MAKRGEGPYPITLASIVLVPFILIYIEWLSFLHLSALKKSHLRSSVASARYFISIKKMNRTFIVKNLVQNIFCSIIFFEKIIKYRDTGKNRFRRPLNPLLHFLMRLTEESFSICYTWVQTRKRWKIILNFMLFGRRGLVAENGLIILLRLEISFSPIPVGWEECEF